IGDGFDGEEVKNTLEALQKNGVIFDIVSEKLGPVTAEDGTALQPNKTFMTTHPTLYDAIYVVGGKSENQLKFDQYLMDFVRMQYVHIKPIGVASSGHAYLLQGEQNNMAGVVSATDNAEFAAQFIEAIAKKRFW